MNVLNNRCTYLLVLNPVEPCEADACGECACKCIPSNSHIDCTLKIPRVAGSLVALLLSINAIYSWDGFSLRSVLRSEGLVPTRLCSSYIPAHPSPLHSSRSQRFRIARNGAQRYFGCHLSVALDLGGTCDVIIKRK